MRASATVRRFGILLDGEPVKTPKKRPLQCRRGALAEAIADEWRAQEALINPARMPLTRFANTAIDAVDDAREAVAADIAAYAGRDLLCYRAEAPEALAKLQSKHWDPIIACGRSDARCPAEGRFGRNARRAAGRDARGFCGGAYAPRGFSPDRVARADDADGFGIFGSCAGARAAQCRTLHGRRRTSMRITRFGLWGEDAEAAARRRARRAEFDAACRFLASARHRNAYGLPATAIPGETSAN